MKAFIIVILLAGLSSWGSIKLYKNDNWDVPEAAQKMKNPTKADKENMVVGRAIYLKHCRSCHGRDGEGDGPKAGELDTFPGDFSSEEFQSQTDGALYYKTTEGKGDMPSFKKTIRSDEDRWILVHYMRTFKK
jgi:mono/diheme cytochrome c family protein